MKVPKKNISKEKPQNNTKLGKFSHEERRTEVLNLGHKDAGLNPHKCGQKSKGAGLCAFVRVHVYIGEERICSFYQILKGL